MAGNRPLQAMPTEQLIDEQNVLMRKLQAVSVEVARRASGITRTSTTLQASVSGPTDLPALPERAETIRNRFGLGQAG